MSDRASSEALSRSSGGEGESIGRAVEESGTIDLSFEEALAAAEEFRRELSERLRELESGLHTEPVAGAQGPDHRAGDRVDEHVDEQQEPIERVQETEETEETATQPVFERVLPRVETRGSEATVARRPRAVGVVWLLAVFVLGAVVIGWALNVADPPKETSIQQPASSSGQASGPGNIGQSSPRDDATDATEPAPVGAETFFNEEAGYGFSYPRDWSVTSSGQLARVSSPDDAQVVSFALGPEGLPVSYDSFAALLDKSYDEVQIARYDPISLSGNPAIAVSGRALSFDGVRLRFRAVLAERPGLQSVGAFAAARSGQTVADEAVRIVESLRLGGQA